MRLLAASLLVGAVVATAGSYDSSYDSPSYDDSSYDSSYDNSYDDSAYQTTTTYNNKYYNNNGYDGETSTVVVYETRTAVAADYTTTTTMMHETTTTMGYEAYTTAAPVYMSVAPASGPMTHTVTVGGDAGLKYTPPYIMASPGDMVDFVFYKQNHSVTQSSFDKPCNLLAGGMDSGLMPNPNNTVSPAPVFSFKVVDMKPTWWYCKQRTGTHCGKGMVFAINPTAEKTFSEFQMQAIKLNGTAATTMGYSPPAATQSTVTLIATTTTGYNSMQTGWNDGGSVSCQCACFCGVGSYGSGGQGVNGYGGYPGSLPKPW